MKNNKPTQQSFNFWKWLHVNRIRIVLYTFITVIPISLVFTAYYGSYRTNQRVHFDQEVTGETVYIRDFVGLEDIEALTLDIEWTALKSPTLDENDTLTGGYYDFDMSFAPKSGYNVTSVSVTPVLQTPWTDIRSIGTTTPLTEQTRSIRINFNYELPVRPLWFVTVEEAFLYLKVDYSYVTASNTIQKTAYVIYDISDIDPKPVV